MLYKNDELLSEGLKTYYKINKLPDNGGVNDPWARYKFGFIQAIAFPNFELRKKAIQRHDIHHVLNNLDTSPLGEGLIAAWELGSGCGKYWISWFMESQALWWGILRAPRKTLSLFALGKQSRNFFKNQMGIDVKTKTIGELRSWMIPENQNLTLDTMGFLRFSLIAAFGILCMIVFIPIASLFTLMGFLLGENKS